MQSEKYDNRPLFITLPSVTIAIAINFIFSDQLVLLLHPDHCYSPLLLQICITINPCLDCYKKLFAHFIVYSINTNTIYSALKGLVCKHKQSFVL